MNRQSAAVRYACRTVGMFLLACLTSSSTAKAQNNKDDVFNKIGKKGPFVANLGGVAMVQVPAEYYFIPKENMRAFNDIFGNSTSPSEMGAMVTTSGEYFVVFEWSDVGYIKDDEKDKLDANAILQSLRNGQEADNQERRKQGRPTMQLVGWEQAPFYDPQTNNLTWATRIQSADGGVSVNYNRRILGRHGFMSAILVVEPEKLATSMPAYNQLMAGYSYKEGAKYSEWRAGDKVAAYGLGALITGGAVAAAAKSGLLGKLLKPIIFGICILGGVIGSFFKKLFGSKAATETSE